MLPFSMEKMIIIKYIKSPLNYIGGKYKLLPQILPYFPKHIHTFIDLFSGGANVGINVNASKVVFNDINYKINNFFRYIQGKKPATVISKIERVIKRYHLSKTNKQGFLALRADYNQNPSSIKLYTLVAYSFNYQFRFNNHLKFNNPFGKNRSSFTPNMKKHLIDFMNKLNHLNAVFTTEPFNHLDLSNLTSHDFVYADPPYLITDGSYNDGNRGFKNWTKVQEEQLHQLLDDLNNHHIKWALSDVTEHKEKTNYLLLTWLKQNNYHIHKLNYSYQTASYNTARKGSQEVLITDY